MSPRAASPLKDDRSTKRSKTATPTPQDMLPDKIAEIVSGGDGILVLNGMAAAPATSIGLRVSTHALSLASPVFGDEIARHKPPQPNADATTSETIISLPGEDADAMLLLCHILHLQNDKLPTRIAPSLLLRLGALARKYECVVAAGRATVYWFDNLYFADDPGNIWEIIEAAYLWDEAIFFARFTSMWVLRQLMNSKGIAAATTIETQKLAWVLSERLGTVQSDVRNEIDNLIETCAFTFSKGASHYIDYAAGLSPTTSETPSGKSTHCVVDAEGAKDYLGAIRDAGIWPSTCWSWFDEGADKHITVGELVEKIKVFREPPYDDCDRCAGCFYVKENFTEELERVQEKHAKRLWGQCLDCYKAGGTEQGECRYQHAK
ncbi:hypothetical protein LTR09_007916 [Extremus antarcticus]|uniref:BTB domain-containing protein n=1 Tax=Extremus antarcticus TaxID=702011 RepID=A0AAJ0DIH1_9PEZI|nr:hypothetical protein LTR09_007916 [Extremus antarcticus]